jgi:hypothetical protein
MIVVFQDGTLPVTIPGLYKLLSMELIASISLVMLHLVLDLIQEKRVYL